MKTTLLKQNSAAPAKAFALRFSGKQRIYTSAKAISNAWNSDRVLVKLTKEGSQPKEKADFGTLNQSLLAS